MTCKVRFPLLALLLLVCLTKCPGCFILFMSDGKEVLVGNHEDWFAKDAAVKINAPATDSYGSVIFTFLSEGWAQGGMNEKGLFLDAARTPFQEIQFAPGAKRFSGYIWQAVLDKCANVEEAIRFLNDYELKDLQEIHVLLADATGHAVILGVHDGQLAIKPFAQTYLMQTNFNPWNPELSDEPICRRYETAEKHLSMEPAASLENMKRILEQTHQDTLTVYSNIYDLKNKIIYTYNKRNFNKAIVLKLNDVFTYGNCFVSLGDLEANASAWKNCKSMQPHNIVLSGKVIDKKTKNPIPFSNIGIVNKNIGTLSDPDGSFEITIPFRSENDTLVFSSIGFRLKEISIAEIRRSRISSVELAPASTILHEVVVVGKKTSAKVKRLGWMGGKDGILPFDTIQGGGAVALLLHSPAVPFHIEKLQVRLMYNAKDTVRLRLHFYAFDTLKDLPSHELLSKEIMLKETKRFGWLRYDLSEYKILLSEKYFLVAFEWIDNRETRKLLYEGFLNWEKWKKTEYDEGNKNVELRPTENGNRYHYHGNMMTWPGFTKLPPFTGLMIKTGKDDATAAFRTFERKTSFGQWREIPSTLNAVVTISY